MLRTQYIQMESNGPVFLSHVEYRLERRSQWICSTYGDSMCCNSHLRTCDRYSLYHFYCFQHSENTLLSEGHVDFHSFFVYIYIHTHTHTHTHTHVCLFSHTSHKNNDYFWANNIKLTIFVLVTECIFNEIGILSLKICKLTSGFKEVIRFYNLLP